MILSASKFIQYLLNGLSVGSMYALVALGYTMVYGIIKLINFAHGDFIMVGCYVAFSLTGFFLKTNLPSWAIVLLVTLCCMVIVGLLGFVTEKVAYKPLRKSKRITALITAIGVSLLLENIYLVKFGSQNKSVTKFSNLLNLGSFKIGSVEVQGIVIMALAMLVVATVCITIFVKKTRAGKAMQAVSENPDAAMLMGVNINKTISLTFVIGTVIAGLTSALYCAYYGSISPTLGSMLGIKAFVAAVVGGIGLIPGAVIGGLLIGLVEALVSYKWGSAYLDAITFGILILVLLIKPNGLLGKNRKEKV